jgi:hypothetical protein
LLDDQQAFFVALQDEVKKHAAKQPAEVEAAVPAIMAALKKNARIARYVGNSLLAQVEKAFVEQGGQSFPRLAIPAK